MAPKAPIKIPITVKSGKVVSLKLSAYLPANAQINTNATICKPRPEKRA